MPDQPPSYYVVSQVQRNKFIVGLGKAIEGWDVTVHDNVTDTFVTVFVDDAHYTADGVRTAVEAALAPVREVKQLG